MSTSAETIRLFLPIDCEIGLECFVQKSGKGYRDFHCGGLTYDGYRGTDFRLLRHATLTDGIAVIAVAPGTVQYTRYCMPDIDVRLVGHDAVTEFSIGKRIRNGSSTIKNSAAVLFRSIAHEKAPPLPAGQYRASFTL